MSPYRMSHMEAGIRAVLEFKEAFNRHDVAGIMQLMAEDCTLDHYHPAPKGTLFAGKAAVTQFWEQFFRQSPQARIKAEDAFGFDRHCVMRWKYTWEQTGGEEKQIRGVDVFRVEKGIIHEQFSYVKGS